MAQRRITFSNPLLWYVQGDTMSKSNFSIEYFASDPQFRKWVLGSDKENHAQWQRFLADHPDEIDVIRQAIDLVHEVESLRKMKSHERLAPQKKEEYWESILAKVQKSDSKGKARIIPISVDTVGGKKPLRRKWTNYRSLAAAIAFFFIVTGAWVIVEFNNQKNINDQELANDWTINANPSGVKSTVRLDDGSIVYLNSGSSIKYVEGFSADKREIFLEGEAYFEVKKDSLRPFIVQTNEISTTALGTAFNIKVYRDKKIQVALLSGKVEVQNHSSNQKEVLMPGEGVSAKNDSWDKIQVNEESVLAWTNKTILLDKATWEETIFTLENWFGVKIKIVNEPPGIMPITARYRDESLENVLDGLSYRLDFSFDINGKEATVNFK